MDDEAEYTLTHDPHCGQMQNGRLPPPFNSPQYSELSQEPRTFLSGNILPCKEDIGLVSYPTFCQNTLDSALFEERLSQPLLSGMTGIQDVWDPAMGQASLLSSDFTNYERYGAGENLFPLDTKAAISTETDLDFFSAGTPLFHDFEDLSRLESFEYELERKPNLSTPSRIHTENQCFDYQYPNSASSYSKPSFDDLYSRPGSTVYPSLSPPNSIGSSPPGDSTSYLYGPGAILRSIPDTKPAISDDDTDDDSASSEEPYAVLIYKALKSAPGHKMVLKEIYEWFENNTNKAKNSDSKGWQNSIRHNLSMNAAFEGIKETSSPGGQSKKSGNAWILTDRAIRYGVQSTTRYRKPGIHKKIPKSEYPAPLRQRSGAKGGRAAKKAAKYRRVSQRIDRHQQSAGLTDSPCSANPLTTQITTTDTVKYEPASPTSIPGAAFSVKNEYEFGDFTGCNANLLPQSPFFYPKMELFPDMRDLNGQINGPNLNY